MSGGLGVENDHSLNMNITIRAANFRQKHLPLLMSKEKEESLNTLPSWGEHKT